VFWSPPVKGWYFGARICIIAGNKPMMERLLNFEHLWNPSNCPDASGTRTNTDIQSDGVPKKNSVLMQDLWLCLPPAITLVSCSIILQPWRWRRHVLPKRLLTFNGLHGVISQKIELANFLIKRCWKRVNPSKTWDPFFYHHNTFSCYVYEKAPDSLVTDYQRSRGKYCFQSL
jgi:hypothetical protein